MTSLRSLTLEDVPSLVAINNSGVPAVPLCDEETMQQLLDLSSLALGLMGTEGDELLGFLSGNGFRARLRQRKLPVL